jgi:3-oxoadipate enol-lactonase / 4-carboxymuconolactone decarboxylase
MTMPHYLADGPQDGPPLLLGPSLGTSLRLWDAQVPALARRHRVIRWDLPGHGSTPASVLPDLRPGATTVADLARLVLGLADELGIGRFAHAGVSLGGAVGAWLAAHHPERVVSLVMVCSSAHFGPPEPWLERAELVRAKGTGSLVESAYGRWFTAALAADPTPAVRALIEDLRTTDPGGYAACCDALAGYDLRDGLSAITAPTLVIAGRDDQATPPAHGRELADGIAGASLAEISHASHLALVERPQAVLAALLGHLTEAEDGMSVRRAVLGDAHVDRAIARTTPFTADFQDLVTRYAWGEIWTRPGLDRRTRSCITLTALVAHGHLDELAMHVRAAIRNGLSRDEIKEVLLQTAVYCGVPAANSAFATAQRVLDELDSES